MNKAFLEDEMKPESIQSVLQLNQAALKIIYNAWQKSSHWAEHYQEGIALLRSALEMEPENMTTLTNLGTALCDTHKFQEAEVLLKKAIALGSQDYNTWFSLAVTLLNYRSEHIFSKVGGKEAGPHTITAYFDANAQ